MKSKNEMFPVLNLLRSAGICSYICDESQDAIEGIGSRRSVEHMDPLAVKTIILINSNYTAQRIS